MEEPLTDLDGTIRKGPARGSELLRETYRLPFVQG